MPSVRVRRGTYSTISGDASTARRPLTSIFNSDPQLEDRPASIHGEPLARRASRTRSRIEDSLHYFSNQKGKGPANPESATLDPPLRPGADSRILHGEDVDVELHSTTHSVRGRIDSVLGSDIQSQGDNPFRDDHEDDVVEHLDVIDPQVSTVATLTNAANSILIPPMGFYSRRPLFTLSPPARNAQGLEKVSQYEDELDQHVDDLLNGRKAKIRRALQGLWSFLKTPMGIITAFYGFCVVFWGAAIVFFLAKLINLHDDNLQGFWVEVSSQVVNGLFTVTGIGFIPYRTLDTYRILRIWHYKRLTRKLRRKAGLPALLDEDDLPDPIYDPNYVHVLTDKQQHELHRQQRKFHYSQSWYRPHGTITHRAFPISYALLICFLNDMNSVFQIMLCATMWSMNRFQRPAWSTGILIPAGFLCGVGAAIVIWKGGQRTRRTKAVEERLRAALELAPTTRAGQPTPLKNEIEQPIPAFRVERTLRPESQHTVEELMTVPAASNGSM